MYSSDMYYRTFKYSGGHIISHRFIKIQSDDGEVRNTEFAKQSSARAMLPIIERIRYSRIASVAVGDDAASAAAAGWHQHLSKTPRARARRAGIDAEEDFPRGLYTPRGGS